MKAEYKTQASLSQTYPEALVSPSTVIDFQLKRLIKKIQTNVKKHTVLVFSLIMPDSENKTVTADETNHLTSHDDDEGQRQKRHSGLFLRLKLKENNCKLEL